MLETKFNQLVKPILYHWFYTAKQNVYLKRLVEDLKYKKLGFSCEYCSMDIELEAIEKK